MNELFLKVGQMKTDIEASISNVYETPQKTSKFDNLTAINTEIANLNQKVEAIKQMINKMNSDIASLRYMVNTSTTIDNANIWRRYSLSVF